MQMLEEGHQIALFDWAHLQRGAYPLLRLLYAVPNGGFRHKRTAGRMKAQGAKAGVPDVVLPVARHGFHGLYIELKRPAGPGSKAGTTSAIQKEWIADLREQGYRAEIAFGWEQAAEILKEYLS